MDDKSKQRRRFEDAAKGAGVELDEDALKAALRQIGQHKPKPEKDEKPDE